MRPHFFPARNDASFKKYENEQFSSNCGQVKQLFSRDASPSIQSQSVGTFTIDEFWIVLLQRYLLSKKFINMLRSGLTKPQKRIIQFAQFKKAGETHVLHSTGGLFRVTNCFVTNLSDWKKSDSDEKEMSYGFFIECSPCQVKDKPKLSGGTSKYAIR